MSNEFLESLFKAAGREYRPTPTLDTNGHHTNGTQSTGAETVTETNTRHAQSETQPNREYVEPGTDRANAYVEGVIDEETHSLSITGEGERNHRLFQVSARLGDFVGGGYLDENTARHRVAQAARECGLPDDEIRKSLDSGMRAGRASGWTLMLPQRERDSFPEATVLDDVPGTPGAASGGARRHLRLTKADRKSIRRLRWLWKDMVPAGGLTLWAGHAGIGKSQGAVWLAAQATNGTLAGEMYGEPTDVLYVGTEDFWNETILPRLAAADADLDRVYKVEAGIARGEEFEGTGLYLDLHMDHLRDAIRESGAKLVILDALLDVMKVEDLNKQGVTRQRISEIQRMGQELKVAFIGVCHFKKEVSSGPALHMISGSAEFGQVVRSAVGFAENKETGECVISQMKRNLVKKGAGAYGYRMVDAYVQSGDPDDLEPIEIGKFELLDPSDLLIEDILAAEKGGGNTKADACAAWLLNYMEHSDGPVLATEIEGKAEAIGYSGSTIDRARRAAKIETCRLEFGGPWYWKINSSP